MIESSWDTGYENLHSMFYQLCEICSLIYPFSCRKFGNNDFNRSIFPFSSEATNNLLICSWNHHQNEANSSIARNFNNNDLNYLELNIIQVIDVYIKRSLVSRTLNHKILINNWHLTNKWPFTLSHAVLCIQGKKMWQWPASDDVNKILK